MNHYGKSCSLLSCVPCALLSPCQALVYLLSLPQSDVLFTRSMILFPAVHHLSFHPLALLLLSLPSSILLFQPKSILSFTHSLILLSHCNSGYPPYSGFCLPRVSWSLKFCFLLFRIGSLQFCPPSNFLLSPYFQCDPVFPIKTPLNLSQWCMSDSWVPPFINHYTSSKYKINRGWSQPHQDPRCRLGKDDPRQFST